MPRKLWRRRSCPIDNAEPIIYLSIMSKLARILVVALLAVFAAGSVVHATVATTMIVNMTFADDGLMDMADCASCDTDENGDESGLVCDFVCTAPFIAGLGPATALSLPAAVSRAASTGSYDFVGRTGPPDPYPPRTLI